MKISRTMSLVTIAAVLALGAAGAVVAKAGAQDAPRSPSSRAYAGHENDADMKGFARQYPAAVGTRLDDCQTCHRGGVKGTDTEREYSPCGYCHPLVFPNPRYAPGVPGPASAAPASSGSTRCPPAMRNTTGRTAGRSSAAARS